MMTRRVLLGTGAVVAGGAAVLGAAQITHRLDDAARLVGLEPKPEPDPRDDEIVRETAADQAKVAAAVTLMHRADPSLRLAPIVDICEQQLRAVSNDTVGVDVVELPESPAALAALLTKASQVRAAAAAEAFSPELVRVLASMSAGLAQCARKVTSL